MGLAGDASADWQLLAAVHPIFASTLPSAKLGRLGRHERDVLDNLETVFEFESWLLPDALREAKTSSLFVDAPGECASCLSFLLQSLEGHVHPKALGMHQFSHLEPSRAYDQPYPKLRALQRELEARRQSQSGLPIDHAQGIRSLVWHEVTMDSFSMTVICLERFNRTVNRLSSNSHDEPLPEHKAIEWTDEELRSFHDAWMVSQSLDMIFESFCKNLRACPTAHTAMISITLYPKVDLILSSCTEKRTWHQIVCSAVTGERYGCRSHALKSPLTPALEGLQAHNKAQVADLCGILRSSRHKLLHLLCNESEIWQNSDETVPVLRESAKVTLLKLLEARADPLSKATSAPLLSKKSKKIIAVILAGFLLRLFGSKWLRAGWTSRNLHFWPDSKTGESTNLQKPYLLCSLVNPDRPEDDLADLENAHSLVFTFGLLMLELELDTFIDVTEDDAAESDELSPPSYMALQRVFHLWKDDVDDPYMLQIINSCLDFDNIVESMRHPSLDEHLKRRAAVVRHIVQPLVNRLEAAHSDVALEPLGVPQHLIKPKQARGGNQTHEPASFPTRALAQLTRVLAPKKVRKDSNREYPSVKPRHRRDFRIAVICALTLEADAVEAIFDERWDDEGDGYGRLPGDRNTYSTGRIGQHNVVLAHMPGMGNFSAAIVATNCRFSFPGIELALVVGICGGVPFNHGEEILLGDVVISEGIVPYDFGRQYPDRLSRRNTVRDNLARPNPEIRAFLAKLKGRLERKNLQDKAAEYLAVLQRELDGSAAYPGATEDKLFTSSYRHKHQDPTVCPICRVCRQKHDPVCEQALQHSCERLGCDRKYLVPRMRLIGQNLLSQPSVHFGLVASGNMVMKSGEDRDQIAIKEDVIAFEMEGAGVWENFPCVVIKGVCDYADSHKSKKWQYYAAATAAACTKAFLQRWIVSTGSGHGLS
ncbi:uncharacterized protein Z518_08064 [Rhinocladiella mackenziei CBS 650.93]|uniref:Nucleoside phosphorylase domain-containing protein n=1 Tax=Rhinocladiella mackenziei CBS 650.93 TaxID=1442369 RepID=A0A0D2IZT1_9EURO|nr:uncharacterized protein Z518_08064 [Rhinocladiella mackenziei CBS 650.93]KIX02125.1 hypothetical protein Z518_08064 [Rhinocladiella mackenziei CBS 650.93]